MGKTSELDMVIKDLQNAAAAINNAAETLAEMFGGKAAEETISAPVEPGLTLEQVRAVLAEKSRAGKTADVKELLKNHGADKLSDINASEYAALLAEAEVL
ncbi:MAG: DNA ligase [Roseburia sp.]|nr:DNA ligase [Roseburia sp.]